MRTFTDSPYERTMMQVPHRPRPSRPAPAPGAPPCPGGGGLGGGGLLPCPGGARQHLPPGPKKAAPPHGGPSFIPQIHIVFS